MGWHWLASIREFDFIFCLDRSDVGLELAIRNCRLAGLLSQFHLHGDRYCDAGEFLNASALWATTDNLFRGSVFDSFDSTFLSSVGELLRVFFLAGA